MECRPCGPISACDGIVVAEVNECGASGPGPLTFSLMLTRLVRITYRKAVQYTHTCSQTDALSKAGPVGWYSTDIRTRAAEHA
jgi:hypothetical protein